MASVIRKLKDADLEAVHHMIRRRAHTQLEIAREIERRLGKKIAKNDAARQRIVSRYANSTVYANWLKRWQNQDVELKKALDAQKRRYELISSLVKKDNENNFEAVSKSIQARLLTAAAEADIGEIKEAVAGRGWLANVLRLVQEHARQEKQRAGAEAADAAVDEKLSPEERQLKIKEIFGLA